MVQTSLKPCQRAADNTVSKGMGLGGISVQTSPLLLNSCAMLQGERHKGKETLI